MSKAVCWSKTFSSSITKDQQELALAFENMLVHAAASAGKDIGSLKIYDAGRHGEKMEERFFQDGPKFHGFYRASVGSTAERIVYQHLDRYFRRGSPLVQAGDWAGVFNGLLGTTDALLDITYAIEYTDSYNSVLPCKFKKSRPDIRLALGQGSDGKNYEALFDLTAEGSVGHILKKGDSWLSKTGVAYVSEIVWANDDIMHKT